MNLAASLKRKLSVSKSRMRVLTLAKHSGLQTNHAILGNVMVRDNGVANFHGKLQYGVESPQKGLGNGMICGGNIATCYGKQNMVLRANRKVPTF